MPTLVQVERLHVHFGELRAVDGAGLTLEEGQLLGLVGPNGAGKTTLLRALAGLQPVTSGHMHILGQELTDLSSEPRQHIGFAPDVMLMYPELSVEDFLRFVGRSYDLGATGTEESIGFWLDKLWLTEKRTERISSLSRGMLQRLGIARALMPNPTVILLDEPAAGLDPAGRVQFRQLLAALRDQGKAIIVSSHILADLHEYCTHIAIMQHGRFLKYGTVAAITSADQNRQRYHLTFVHPVPQVRRILEEDPLLKHLNLDGTQAEFEYEHDPERAAELLRKLVSDGVPVCAFEPLAGDLEQAYLKTGIRQVD